jgi:hypothetical protein
VRDSLLSDDRDRLEPSFPDGARELGRLLVWAAALVAGLAIPFAAAVWLMNIVSPSRDMAPFGVGAAFAVLAVGGIYVVRRSRHH